MEIRRLETKDFEEMRSLVLSVFMQFEAPDYGEEGIETFKRCGICDEDYVRSLSAYGAFIADELVGVIATRSEGRHIALFFVRGEYHRQGIGRALFETVRHEGMSVNSSPYAKRVYERLGFVQTEPEQVFGGMRYIPMRYL